MWYSRGGLGLGLPGRMKTYHSFDEHSDQNTSRFLEKAPSYIPSYKITP